MGMSASQARYLGLIARQSDLEYQGQQINQERTVLSQQVTDLYNTLQNMTVPTPPSTTDYTSIEYSGTIGATAYTFDASSIKPGTNGGYMVTVNQDGVGDTLEKNAAVATVKDNSEGNINLVSVQTKVTNDATITTDRYKDDTTGNSYLVKVDDASVPETERAGYYVKENNEYRPATDEDAGPFYTSCKKDQEGAIPVSGVTKTQTAGEQKAVSSSEVSNYYVLESGTTVRKANADDFTDNGDGTFSFKEDVTYLEVPAAGGGSTYRLAGSETTSNGNSITVNGNAIFTLDSAVNAGVINETQKGAYEAAIKSSGITKPDGTPYAADDFYIYFDKNDNNSVNFVLKADVNDGNNNAITYAYVTGAIINVPTTYDGCELDFDPTSGRITALSLPNYDENGEISSYTSMKVSAKTVTDENAYQDAYAQYEYAKYEYDKTQQEINAKTEVIQQEDKRLELKLQRLDNERTQITTEIEAVEKVINDNIEASYKTFSG